MKQHREILVLAGWVALLVGCVEYDMGSRQAAETTRQAALSLGVEADHGEIIAWAHEMRAWINLTNGDYHGVVAAARNGTGVTPHHSVAVQLFAQEAKAWARIGDRRQTEVALDKGRRLLDTLPYPENLDNHFVVDPMKFDFYAMDCYRTDGEPGPDQGTQRPIRRRDPGAGLPRPAHVPDECQLRSQARGVAGITASRRVTSGNSIYTLIA